MSRKAFVLMGAIALLLNVNYAILRGLRNTLAVVTLGGGAHSIPLFELCGALPGALLMTWGLSRLMQRWTWDRVFALVLTLFLGFFLLFAAVIHPLLAPGHLVSKCCAMLFYVLAELWKPALYGILFWGLLNHNLPIERAKRLYAPLLFGGGLGVILAGPIIAWCTTTTLWLQSFNLMIGIVCVLGVVGGWMYMRLCRLFEQKMPPARAEQTPFTQGLSDCASHPPLRLLTWIVIADYLAYSMGEVIFFHVLKLHYPEPTAYCHYLGYLSTVTGILTLLSSVVFTPLLLRRYTWGVIAQITPLCVLATGGLFWFFLPYTALAVVFGSLQYCLCRAAKSTLFDASKELAFVTLTATERIKGKLIIDGLAARCGRGLSALLSLGVIQLAGGVMASALPLGIFALGITLSWMKAVGSLSKRLGLVSE